MIRRVRHSSFYNSNRCFLQEFQYWPSMFAKAVEPQDWRWEPSREIPNHTCISYLVGPSLKETEISVLWSSSLCFRTAAQSRFTTAPRNDALIRLQREASHILVFREKVTPWASANAVLFIVNDLLIDPFCNGAADCNIHTSIWTVWSSQACREMSDSRRTRRSWMYDNNRRQLRLVCERSSAQTLSHR